MTKEALKSAIEFAEYCLEELDLSHMASNQAKRLVQKSKEALAQPEQEPVAWWNGNSKFATPKAKDWDKRTGGTTAFGCDIPLYTTPPQRTWVGLSREDCYQVRERESDAFMCGVAWAEAKLKEKNTLLALPVVTLPLEIK